MGSGDSGEMDDYDSLLKSLFEKEEERPNQGLKVRHVHTRFAHENNLNIFFPKSKKESEAKSNKVGQDLISNKHEEKKTPGKG